MKRDIRLHDIPTIIGTSKNPSPWELWNICTGAIEEPPRVSAASDWRRLLRRAAIDGLQKRYGCTLADLPAKDPPDAPVRLYDLIAIGAPGALPLTQGSNALLLRQTSRDAFQQVWKRGSAVEAPIEDIAKAQIYMAAYGLQSIAIFVLAGGGEDEALVEIAFDKKVADDITAKIAAFRASIEAGDEPAPDYSVDWKGLAAKYLPTDPEELNLSDRPDVAKIAEEYAAGLSKKSAAQRLVKEAEAHAEARKAMLKAILGNHATARLPDGSQIVFKQVSVGPKQSPGYSYATLNIVPPLAKSA